MLIRRCGHDPIETSEEEEEEETMLSPMIVCTIHCGVDCSLSIFPEHA